MESALPHVLVNGQPWPMPASGLTVAGLVAGLGRDPRTMAVELNGQILPRAAWEGVALAAGDRLEVVQFVQGG